MKNYADFLSDRKQSDSVSGFEPLWIPKEAFGFQEALISWQIRKGRGALMTSCGTGKTLMELAVAENIVRKTNGNVLLAAPIAVGTQTVKEGEKFGVECHQSRDGKIKGKITVSNYEQLHKFNPGDFVAMIGDESGILKDNESKTKSEVTEFMRMLPYRMIGTATPAPNDFIELGNSSEVLGELGFADMITRFFKKITQTSTRADEFKSGNWRFRGHAEQDFWKWVCSWARAIRKPSDLGFDDGNFKLPELIVRHHVVTSSTAPEGFLFPVSANGFFEERQENRRTIEERCQQAADLVNNSGKPFFVFCNLNDESKYLSKIIPDAREVWGNDSDEEKEEAFSDFVSGRLRGVISKARIAGYGLNLQNCAHAVIFPSHSYEQWHQMVRRFWRFGQSSDVVIDVVTSEGQTNMLSNLRRKEAQAEGMFENLVRLMNDGIELSKINPFTKTETLPSWI